MTKSFPIIQAGISRRLYSLLIIFVFTFVSSLSVNTQDEEAVIVDASQIVAEVSPYAYGSNIGPFAIPIDLFDMAAESGITFLRFPHGEWGDQNNLSHFNIDLFIQMAKLIGAEPSIALRIKDGEVDVATEIVHYTNIEKEYGVKYWYIGNEPNLFGDYYTAPRHAEEWRTIALAILEVDPTITLIGPGISQWNGVTVDPDDSEGNNWLRTFLQANGDLVDIVSVHRYPFPLSSTRATTIDDVRNNISEWDNTLTLLREVILEETGRDDYPVAITEFNSHWGNRTGGIATNGSFNNALFVADVLGRTLRHEPFTIGQFDYMATVSRGDGGLMNEFDVSPTYYSYQLYKHFGNEVIHTESSVEYLGVYGALRDDGALTLIAVNQGDSATNTPLAISGFDGTVSEIRLLTEDILAESVENTVLINGMLTMPARSAVLIVLE